MRRRRQPYRHCGGAGAIAVSLVQYTREHTNLLDKRPGDPVNIEADIIALCVESILAAR